MDRSRSLKKGPEFDQVYQEGTVIGGPLFVVRVRPNGVGHARWGFAVGKKLSKSSVVRNRVKRRLKEAARQLGLDEPVDVIVTARPPVLDARFGRIRDGLAAALRRSGHLEGRKA